jgi:hypothetical protein
MACNGVAAQANRSAPAWVKDRYRQNPLEGPRVLKSASGVSLAATFDGEFSDVTRSYARQGRGALAQSKPAPHDP